MHLMQAFGPFLETYILWLPVFLFILLLFIVFIQGFETHVFVLLFGGRKGVVQTMKTIMYAFTPVIFLGWIPIISIVGGVWTYILIVIGIRENQEMPPPGSPGRAHPARALPDLLRGRHHPYRAVPPRPGSAQRIISQEIGQLRVIARDAAITAGPWLRSKHGTWRFFLVIVFLFIFPGIHFFEYLSLQTPGPLPMHRVSEVFHVPTA